MARGSMHKEKSPNGTESMQHYSRIVKEKCLNPAGRELSFFSLKVQGKSNSAHLRNFMTNDLEFQVPYFLSGRCYEIKTVNNLIFKFFKAR